MYSMSLRRCPGWAAGRIVNPFHAQRCLNAAMEPYVMSRAMVRQDIPIFNLDPSLRPLLGCISWHVNYGLTNLSMEFGKPSVRVIHEPVPNIRITRKPRNVSLMEIRRRANRRQVSVCGQWGLWVYFANWRIVRSGVCLASKCSSMRTITPALLDLQGQRLVGISVNSQTGATRFEFDLDTALEVRRKHRCSTDELWLLYGLDGYQRTVRGDGTFRREECRL